MRFSTSGSRRSSCYRTQKLDTRIEDETGDLLESEHFSSPIRLAIEWSSLATTIDKNDAMFNSGVSRYFIAISKDLRYSIGQARDIFRISLQLEGNLNNRHLKVLNTPIDQNRAEEGRNRTWSFCTSSGASPAWKSFTLERLELSMKIFLVTFDGGGEGRGSGGNWKMDEDQLVNSLRLS